MSTIILIVLPVFALILSGWVVRRTGLFGPDAAGVLNRFVVYLALPALLFDIVSRARISEIWQPDFITSFGAGCLLVFLVTLVIRHRGGVHPADAAIDALGTGYPNTGYMGFPLALAALGPAAMTPTMIASIITVCVIFAVAIALIEISLQNERHPGRLILKLTVSFAKNPLLLAPLLAAFFPVTGIAIPGTATHFLQLLGGAASPCALVSLGLFLAERREKSTASAPVVGTLIGLKLILQPLATWVLAEHVFRLPPIHARSAVLLAALPTGTGPFMLAEYYRRDAGTTSKVIFGSTVLSVITITAYLAVSA